MNRDEAVRLWRSVSSGADLVTGRTLELFAQAVEAAERERWREDLLNAEGMAGCMELFRADMIRLGVITDATPPMFMTEAIVSALRKAGWRPVESEAA